MSCCPSPCTVSSNSALHLAVINSQQEVVQCLLEIMAGLPESYISEYNFLRQVGPPIYHLQCMRMIYMIGNLWYFVTLTHVVCSLWYFYLIYKVGSLWCFYVIYLVSSLWYFFN